MPPGGYYTSPAPPPLAWGGAGYSSYNGVIPPDENRYNGVLPPPPPPPSAQQANSLYGPNYAAPPLSPATPNAYGGTALTPPPPASWTPSPSQLANAQQQATDYATGPVSVNGAQFPDQSYVDTFDQAHLGSPNPYSTGADPNSRYAWGPANTGMEPRDMGSTLANVATNQARLAGGTTFAPPVVMPPGPPASSTWADMAVGNQIAPPVSPAAPPAGVPPEVWRRAQAMNPATNPLNDAAAQTTGQHNPWRPAYHTGDLTPPAAAASGVPLPILLGSASGGAQGTVRVPTPNIGAPTLDWVQWMNENQPPSPFDAFKWLGEHQPPSPFDAFKWLGDHQPPSPFDAFDWLGRHQPPSPGDLIGSAVSGLGPRQPAANPWPGPPAGAVGANPAGPFNPLHGDPTSITGRPALPAGQNPWATMAGAKPPTTQTPKGGVVPVTPGGAAGNRSAPPVERPANVRFTTAMPDYPFAAELTDGQKNVTLPNGIVVPVAYGFTPGGGVVRDPAGAPRAAGVVVDLGDGRGPRVVSREELRAQGIDLDQLMGTPAPTPQPGTTVPVGVAPVATPTAAESGGSGGSGTGTRSSGGSTRSSSGSRSYGNGWSKDYSSTENEPASWGGSGRKSRNADGGWSEQGTWQTASGRRVGSLRTFDADGNVTSDIMEVTTKDGRKWAVDLANLPDEVANDPDFQDLLARDPEAAARQLAAWGYGTERGGGTSGTSRARRGNPLASLGANASEGDRARAILDAILGVGNTVQPVAAAPAPKREQKAAVASSGARADGSGAQSAPDVTASRNDSSRKRKRR